MFRKVESAVYQATHPRRADEAPTRPHHNVHDDFACITLILCAVPVAAGVQQRRFSCGRVLVKPHTTVNNAFWMQCGAFCIVFSEASKEAR